eukprot:2616287-Rhodomonas_salina.1
MPNAGHALGFNGNSTEAAPGHHSNTLSGRALGAARTNIIPDTARLPRHSILGRSWACSLPG